LGFHKFDRFSYFCSASVLPGRPEKETQKPSINHPDFAPHAKPPDFSTISATVTKMCKLEIDRYICLCIKNARYTAKCEWETPVGCVEQKIINHLVMESCQAHIDNWPEHEAAIKNMLEQLDEQRRHEWLMSMEWVWTSDETARERFMELTRRLHDGTL
jgi:hypothetical protein